MDYHRGWIGVVVNMKTALKAITFFIVLNGIVVYAAWKLARWYWG